MMLRVRNFLGDIFEVDSPDIKLIPCGPILKCFTRYTASDGRKYESNDEYKIWDIQRAIDDIFKNMVIKVSKVEGRARGDYKLSAQHKEILRLEARGECVLGSKKDIFNAAIKDLKERMPKDVQGLGYDGWGG